MLFQQSLRSLEYWDSGCFHFRSGQSRMCFFQFLCYPVRYRRSDGLIPDQWRCINCQKFLISKENYKLEQVRWPNPSRVAKKKKKSVYHISKTPGAVFTVAAIANKTVMITQQWVQYK
jgi:hypothetical protein